MRYDSARDPQVVDLLRRASGGFFIGAGVLALLAWRFHSDLLAMVAVVTLLLAIGCLWTLRLTWYEISAERLRIRCGPSRLAVSWESVVRVIRTQDRRTAPALSFDRLQVDYRQGKRWRSVLISPVNREQFVEELCRVAGLVAEADAYVRSGEAPGPEKASPHT